MELCVFAELIQVVGKKICFRSKSISFLNDFAKHMFSCFVKADCIVMLQKKWFTRKQLIGFAKTHFNVSPKIRYESSKHHLVRLLKMIRLHQLETMLLLVSSCCFAV